MLDQKDLQEKLPHKTLWELEIEIKELKAQVKILEERLSILEKKVSA